MKVKMKKFIKSTKKVLSYIADSYEKFDKSQRYKVPAFCYNCGYTGEVAILKGVTTLDAFLELKCPACHCGTLTKDRMVIKNFREKEKQ